MKRNPWNVGPLLGVDMTRVLEQMRLSFENMRDLRDLHDESTIILEPDQYHVESDTPALQEPA